MRFPSATTDVQRELIDSVETFAARRQPDARADRVLVHPSGGWRDLLPLGLLEHADSDHPLALADLVVACEALSRSGIVVPIADGCAVYPVLPEDRRAGVIDGSEVCAVALGDPPASPWGAAAELAVAVGRDGSAVVAEVAGTDSADLGGTLPWGFVALGEPISSANGTPVLARYRLLSAATLCGLGMRMLWGASGYVRERRQFGRPLAAFQGVRHPLAESYAATAAALDHVRLVATGPDADAPAAARALDAARQAALAATYACHQVYGGIGYVVEGPMGTIASVVRDLALAEPRVASEETA
jgi:hypothetical protein